MTVPAVEAYAERVVSTAPPLSRAQIDRIVTVLRGAANDRAFLNGGTR